MKHAFKPLLVVLALLLAACDSGEAPKTESVAVEPVVNTNPGPSFGSWGIDMESRDQNVRPGDDFYRYMNGTKLDSVEIAPDQSTYGYSLIIHERAQERVRVIIEELGARSSEMGTPEQKVGDYYASWMDTETINKRGIKPLQPDLDRIAAFADVKDLPTEFGKQYWIGGMSLFTGSLGFDPKNPDRRMINVGLSGLGLPERDYYLEDAKKFLTVRAAYEKHIAQMLGFAGSENPAQQAQDVIALETKIAKIQWVRADRRDRDKTNNPMTVAELRKNHPEFDWSAFFTSAKIGGVKDFNLNHPNTVGPLISLINETPINVWKSYLSYHLISNNAGLLSEEIDNANFDFWGKVIGGRETMLDRWKRGVSRVGAKTGLGEALGQIYVSRHFSESSKQQMVALVENLRAAYGERIKELPWMGDSTKKEALDKLAGFRAKIGYPDKWLDLDAIKIAKDDLFGNARRIRGFFEDRDASRLNEPTDRDEWLMTPQTVNAYYLPNLNEIVFPAAYLEAPNFDPNADSAVNYGAIGATIGHEMGHGFDDQGSKMDAKGVKRDWWTEEDRTSFMERTRKLGAQYSSYEAMPDQFVDGDFTMGENIGDLGGARVAYRAYQLSLDGEEEPIIDGTTGTQRFFMSYAQSFMGKWREEFTLRILKSDPHAPNQFRVNGVVRNMDEWYEAFGVKKGDALYLPPKERVSIW